MTRNLEASSVNDSVRPCADSHLTTQCFGYADTSRFGHNSSRHESGLPRMDLVESNARAGGNEEVIRYADGRCSTLLYDDNGRARKFSTFDNVDFERLDMKGSDLSGYLGGKPLPEGFAAWRVTGGTQRNSAAHNDKWVIARISRADDGIQIETLYPVPQKMVYRNNGDTVHSYPRGKTTTTEYRSTTTYPDGHKPVVVEGSVDGLRNCDSPATKFRPQVVERPLVVDERPGPALDYSPVFTDNPQPFFERRTALPWQFTRPRFFETATTESFYGPNSGHSSSRWGNDFSTGQPSLGLRDLIVGFDVVTNGLANLRRADNPGAIENLNFYGRYGGNYGFGSGFRGGSDWQPRTSFGHGGILPDVLRVVYPSSGYGVDNGFSTVSPWDAGIRYGVDTGFTPVSPWNAGSSLLPRSRARYGVDPYTANIIQNRDLELRRQALQINRFI